MNRVSINDPESIQHAVAVLRAGGVIVYPTDTAYGLGADATNAEAVEKIFALKGRSDNPIPIIVDSVEQATAHVVFSEAAQKLARAFWPGALTLVLEASDRSLAHIIKGETTIGVRMPDYAWCRAVTAELGKPITSTSANSTGTPAEYSLEGAHKSLGEKSEAVDLWIDGGTLAVGPISTVARVVDTPITIKREGAISGADIKKVLE